MSYSCEGTQGATCVLTMLPGELDILCVYKDVHSNWRVLTRSIFPTFPLMRFVLNNVHSHQALSSASSAASVALAAADVDHSL